MEKVKKKRGRKPKKKASEDEEQSARALLELKGVDDEPSSPPLSFSDLDYLSFDTPSEFLSTSAQLQQQRLEQQQQQHQYSSPLQSQEHSAQNEAYKSGKKRKKQHQTLVDDSLVDPELMKGMNAVKAFVESHGGHNTTTYRMTTVSEPAVIVSEPVEEEIFQEDLIHRVIDEGLAGDQAMYPTHYERATDEPASKRQRTKKRADPPSSSQNGSPPKGGTFTAEELKAIHDYFLQYRHSQRPPITHEELCQRVWANNRAKDSFWDSVCEVLPNRSKASIYKHVRRTYHVYNVRGKWTETEDETLRNLVDHRGPAWKKIGEEMERMPEDCRDRWRNYVKCGDRRGQNAWTPGEEDKLRNAVNQHVDEMLRKKEMTQSRSKRLIDETEEETEERLAREREALQDEINWTVVSEKMDGWRSRIQCRYKWNKMKNTSHAPSANNNGNNNTSNAGHNSNNTNNHKAQPVIGKKQDLLIGDQIWLLKQLKNSTVANVADVNWEMLARSDPSNSWLPTDLKTTFTRLKSKVRASARMTVQQVAEQLIDELESLPGGVSTQRTVGKPSYANQKSAAHLAKPAVRREPRQPRKQRKPKSAIKKRKFVSAEFVDPADDADDGDETSLNQEVNLTQLGATAKAAMQYVEGGADLDLYGEEQ